MCIRPFSRSSRSLRSVLLCPALAVAGGGTGGAVRCIDKIDTIPAYAVCAGLDLPDLKRSLEAAGWPATHVQAILGAEIQHRLNPPEAGAASALQEFRFWATGPDALPTPPRLSLAAERQREERERAVRESFDSLFPPTDGSTDNARLLAWEERRRWGGLPLEKRRAISDLLRERDRTKAFLLGSRGGLLTHAEWLQVWQLVESSRQQLEALLSPKELLDYDLRNSATAAAMRAELDNFQPSRAEFVALFRLRHPLELRHAHRAPGVDADQDRLRRADEAACAERIAQLLGPERHAEYLLSLEPACQTLQFDGRHARAEAAAVRRLYQEFKEVKRRLSQPATDPREAARLREGLKAAFRRVLDEEGMRRYLQEQGLWP